MTKQARRGGRNVKVRRHGTGMIVDGLNEYGPGAYTGAILRQPPANFERLIEDARKVASVAGTACGIPGWEDDADKEQTAEELMHVRDVLMLAAWALTEASNEGHGANPVSYVQRAKQVIDWCKPKLEGLTDLAELEAKGREIARVVGQMVYRNEGFVLTIFDRGVGGKGGHSTWISSEDRPTSVALLAELVQAMQNDQQAQQVPAD